jgi:shikimate dehydrogenase
VSSKDRSRQVVGVVGRPIEHSLSPLLHQAAFDALELPWTSVAFDAGPGDGAGVVQAVRSLHLRGLSVTMPLKEEIAASVDQLDPMASLLDSVNCLSHEDGQIVGLSTDGEGLVAALHRARKLDLSEARVLVAGSGGAARSVVAALGASGALEVTVVARDDEAALRVAALAGSIGRVGQATDAALADLVVDATPVGMVGTESEHAAPLIDPSLLHAGQLAVDLVYQPLETPWLEAASRQGAQTMGGLGMLVHQAALQISRWTDMEAPVEAMWEAAERALGRSW